MAGLFGSGAISVPPPGPATSTYARWSHDGGPAGAADVAARCQHRRAKARSGGHRVTEKAPLTFPVPVCHLMVALSDTSPQVAVSHARSASAVCRAVVAR